jgi:hypothetical protein
MRTDRSQEILLEGLGTAMKKAWKRIEVFSKDGKKLVRREESISDGLVRAIVSVILILAFVLLILTGYADLSLPLPAGWVALVRSLLKWVRAV